MKHAKFILPLILASAALMSCGNNGNGGKGKDTVDPNEISVIIMGGQSNMEGNSLTAYLGPEKGFTTEKIQEYSTGYTNVPIFFNNPAGHNTSNHVFVPTRLGQGYNAARFGPELGLADRLNELGYGMGKTGKQVALIKYAWGGTGLAPELKQWASPSIAGGNMCRDYSGFVQTVMEGLGFLENEGYNPVIKAMLWMQGEADACTLSYAQNYLTNTRAFVSDLRDEFAGYYGKKEKEFAYIDAAISAHQYPNGNNIWAYHGLVNAAKATYSAESDLNYYLDTNSGSHDLDTSTEPINNPDYYHYDVASMIDLGKMFADKVVEVINNY